MTAHTTSRTVDAVVIGAGFGGIYAVHKLHNELGLTTVGFDKAAGPGGTWYWNRYPGALSDTESHLYRYSFDRDLLADGTWKNTYITQPEILEYLKASSTARPAPPLPLRHRGRPPSTRRRGQWEVTTDDGAVYHATCVINAVGLLSAINFPNLPGLNRFEGETIHTAAWPEGKDLTGRRVGVIGTGSTGQQVITALAPKVEQLTVFVRTPQYSVPVGNRPVTAQDIDAVISDYDQLRAHLKRSAVAFGFEESTVPAMSVSEEERRRVFEEAWQHGGGFRFMFGTFGDIATDEDANEAAASFIRSKIAEIIEDPETARKLMPTGLFAKRPLCDDGYHRVFNRPNVEAVAIKENPIREVTAKGVVTEDAILHVFYLMVVFCCFFIVSANNQSYTLPFPLGLHINDHWGGQPTSYLGVSTANFPNWFMVLGPNGPFTNLPPSIETQVEWISDTIDFAERNGVESIEPTPEAEAEWTDTCTQVANATLFTKGNSWIFGANVPGKKPSVLFYLGGLGNYRAVLADVTADGFRGFEVKSADMVAA